MSADAGLVEIVLDDPGRLNALDEAGLVELADAFEQAEKDDARALILRGEGRAFCAGRDISAVDPRTDDVHHYLDELLAPLLRRIREFPAPTFGVATGACLGVGLGLLASLDIVYAADTAKIGSPFANLGAVLDSGGHALFVERLGAQRALDLIVTGELMSGREAADAGLFSRAVPADEVLEFARERARRAARGPTLAFLESKRIVRLLSDGRAGFWDTVAEESAAQARLAGTADYREGFAAFREKRPPVFRGE